MLAFLRNRWFLIALIAVLAGGMTWWQSAQRLANVINRNAVVATVMFLMALPMETAAMWKAIRRPGPAWLAATINLGLAPVLGWAAAQLLPVDLGNGVIVATVVPCTLAAATVWTRRAGGNDAVAILVTMITNLACFLVVPAWLRLLIGKEASGAELNYGEMMLQLLLLLVAPILAAQLLRQWRPAGAWADQHKMRLSILAQIGILTFVFAGAVGCGEKLHAVSDAQILTAGNLALMIVLVASLHLALMAIGLGAAKLLRIARADAIAVGIAGSQKTIMAGLFVATHFGALAIVPMVAYHASQLLMDTVIADWLRERSAT
jgi:sodium/bile acid cotransporter 7